MTGRDDRNELSRGPQAVIGQLHQLFSADDSRTFNAVPLIQIVGITVSIIVIVIAEFLSRASASAGTASPCVTAPETIGSRSVVERFVSFVWC